LEALDISGCVVTIDAMGRETDIAETIIEEGADYVLALKDNQQGLRASVEAIFDRLVESDHEAHSPHKHDKHVTGGHDRVETRRCWAVDVDGKGLVDQAG
jgi:predicted transposase YbfD/YdcC